jgi:hypothetical protein
MTRVDRAAMLREITRDIGAADLELDNGEHVSPESAVARDRAAIHALLAIAKSLRVLCEEGR